LVREPNFLNVLGVGLRRIGRLCHY
jgi:hypothetical protein